MSPTPSAPPPPDPTAAGGRTPFSVVLPVFDEELGLAAVLDELQRTLRESGRACEVVVVDDGSTDATPRILAARDDVRLVRHERNRGYGAALKSGIRAARHPLVVIMDADGTYVPAELLSLVDRCETADMVVGARVGQTVHPSPLRASVKWLFRLFARWITRASIPDLNSGLRVFHRAVAEHFMPLLPDGFSFTTTITVGGILEGFTVAFVPVNYLRRVGRSKIHPLRDTVRIGRQLLRLGVRFAPLRTSLAVAALLLVGFTGSAGWHALYARRLVPLDGLWALAAALALVVGLRAEQRRSRHAVHALGSHRKT